MIVNLKTASQLAAGCEVPFVAVVLFLVFQLFVLKPPPAADSLNAESLIRPGADAAILHGIPGVLIHGLYDVSSPLDTAWQLSQRWSTSELHVLDDAGHGGGDTFISAIVGALNRFAAT
jgi:pimeloyl-ACP methyl ester carboxylesterase